MKRWVLIIPLVFLLLPGVLFARGSQEPPELTAPVSIDMWHAMGGSRIQLIEGIVQDFMNQNPNIKVEVQYTGSYNDTLNKTTAAAKAGNAPHVFHLYEIGTLGMANSGMVVPIDDLAKWEKVDWTTPGRSSTPTPTRPISFRLKVGVASRCSVFTST